MDKSKLMMTIIIVLLVLLLGTVVGVTFYLINLVGDQRPDDSRTVIEHDLPPGLLGDLIEVSLERKLTNLAVGPGGTSDVVALEVVLGINNTVDAEEVEEFLTSLNDRRRFASSIVIDVVGDFTYEEVRTPEGRNAVGEEIKHRLQAAFGTNLIINVNFPEWLVQRGRG